MDENESMDPEIIKDMFSHGVSTFLLLIRALPFSSQHSNYDISVHGY